MPGADQWPSASAVTVATSAPDGAYRCSVCPAVASPARVMMGAEVTRSLSEVPRSHGAGRPKVGAGRTVTSTQASVVAPAASVTRTWKRSLPLKPVAGV